jgi:NAD(P)-dependent dehydrogenase (short-subunit alcohol dehydrogenase family)
MKTVALFGASGGLGKQLLPLLQTKYNVIGISSSDIDVTNFTQVNKFFETNNIDIVINLSGYNFDTFTHKINDETLNQIDKQIDVNIKGTINVVSNCLNKMREQQFGRIILVSSVLADHPVISTSIYAGCKGFVDSFTKTVALENANKNINCNSLQLGYFDGGLTYKIPENFRDTIKNNIPAKRWGTIVELYNTIDYLIETGYMTGQNINISGGII